MFVCVYVARWVPFFQMFYTTVDTSYHTALLYVFTIRYTH